MELCTYSCRCPPPCTWIDRLPVSAGGSVRCHEWRPKSRQRSSCLLALGSHIYSRIPTLRYKHGVVCGDTHGSRGVCTPENLSLPLQAESPERKAERDRPAFQSFFLRFIHQLGAGGGAYLHAPSPRTVLCFSSSFVWCSGTLNPSRLSFLVSFSSQALKLDASMLAQRKVMVIDIVNDHIPPKVITEEVHTDCLLSFFFNRGASLCLPLRSC